jgi:hypothetical protein
MRLRLIVSLRDFSGSAAAERTRKISSTFHFKQLEGVAKEILVCLSIKLNISFLHICKRMDWFFSTYVQMYGFVLFYICIYVWTRFLHLYICMDSFFFTLVHMYELVLFTYISTYVWTRSFLHMYICIHS